MTQWFNRRQRLVPEVGGSDAHYLPTVGKTYTLFPGATAQDFRHAMLAGRVRAAGQVYSALTLAWVAARLLMGTMPVARPSAVRAPVRYHGAR